MVGAWASLAMGWPVPILGSGRERADEGRKRGATPGQGVRLGSESQIIDNAHWRRNKPMTILF